MVENKKKVVKAVTRAAVAHKLAKYVRAKAVHLNGGSSRNEPSTSHLILGGSPKKHVTNKANTWYPADDQKPHFLRKRNQPLPAAGRNSIHPGTVVILLAGNQRGRRVVVLKKLPSNELLVTGPYQVNGVPLKKINAAYVLATSTKVDLAGVNTEIDASFFLKVKKYSKNELKDASELKLKKVAENAKTVEKWREEAKAVQKKIDTPLVANIAKVEHLKGYLSTRFTLYNTTKPHELRL